MRSSAALRSLGRGYLTELIERNCQARRLAMVFELQVSVVSQFSKFSSKYFFHQNCTIGETSMGGALIHKARDPNSNPCLQVGSA
jgi:hypothetical protein